MDSDNFQKKLAAFLNEAGWGDAQQTKASADASTKEFYRLTRDDGARALLMHMPVDQTSYSAQASLAKTCHPFIAINDYLTQHDISAPEILAANIGEGFVLLEDLGCAPYEGSSEQINIAVDILLHLHKNRAPEKILYHHQQETYHLPAFTLDILLAEARLFIEWFLPDHNIRPDLQTQKTFDQFWHDSFDRANFAAPVLLLRDYHSPNLIFLSDRASHRGLGIIDHQDALAGPPAYDLVSLLQDARIDISAEKEGKGLNDYLARCDLDEKSFRTSYALLGAQRALKIMGIFVRFARQDHKLHYLQHMPRVISYLKRNLIHKELAPLARFLDQYGEVL